MEKEQQLQQLADIKNLMERSSRFLSLSGLAGVSAGIVGLIGAWFAHSRLQAMKDYAGANDPGTSNLQSLITDLMIMGFIVLVVAIAAGFFFTQRRAKQTQVSIWNPSSRKLLTNLFIPVIAGGAFVLMMLYHSEVRFVAPACLLFYGLGLINASKYTVSDIRYLGYCEIALGIINMFFIGQGLLFWAIGFGIFHILYGTIMYFKYER